MNKPKRLLYVDDNAETRNSFMPILEIFGYLAMPYSSGEQVIEELENGLNYELAIVDRELGRVSGDEVMEACKKYRPNAPVICLSGWGGRPKHCDIFLQKGEDPSELHDFLERDAIQE